MDDLKLNKKKKIENVNANKKCNIFHSKSSFKKIEFKN